MFLDEDRLGRFTASQMHQVLSDKKGFETICYEKAYERLGITKPQEYIGDAIVHGNENEPIGIMTFEMITGKKVTHTGAESEFVKYGDNAGCTPDGRVSPKEGVEIKCPFNPGIFLKQFMIESVDDLKSYSKTYYWQIRSTLLFTDADLWNFVSYHPEFYQKYRKIGILEVRRDQKEEALIISKLDQAEEFTQKIIQKIKSK